LQTGTPQPLPEPLAAMQAAAVQQSLRLRALAEAAAAAATSAADAETAGPAEVHVPTTPTRVHSSARRPVSAQADLFLSPSAATGASPARTSLGGSGIVSAAPRRLPRNPTRPTALSAEPASPPSLPAAAPVPPKPIDSVIAGAPIAVEAAAAAAAAAPAAVVTDETTPSPRVTPGPSQQATEMDERATPPPSPTRMLEKARSPDPFEGRKKKREKRTLALPREE
jgi:hypothetical protein